MKKVISVVMLCFLMLGCQVHFPASSWDHMGDGDAKFAQQLMRQTVKVQVSDLVDAAELTGKEKDYKLLRGSGSGTVVAVKGSKSLVLTAGHVCHNSKTYDVTIMDMDFHLPVIETALSVLTIDGASIGAEVVYKDETADTCVLSVDGVAGEVARMYNGLVPVGAKVIYTGAPEGVWDTHAAPIFEGRYSGVINIAEQDYELFSMPVTGGASGSAIYYRGFIVSIVVARNPDFENISFGATFEATRVAVETALKKWDA